METPLAGASLYREARWMVRDGRTEEAAARFHRAAEVGAGIATLQRNVGLELLLLGDEAGAEAHFLAALAIDPDDEDALYDMAILCAHQDRTEEAVGWFDRMAAANTPYAEVYLNRGLQRLRLADLPGALSDAERALAIEPGLGPAAELVEAVRGAIATGGEQGLLQALQTVELQETNGTLLLAATYLERGDVDRALELYREVAQMVPESVGAAYGVGYGLLRLGRSDEAQAAFRRVLALEPGSAAGRNALAYVFAVSGDSLGTAGRLLEEALQLDPALAAYWKDTLGWVRYREGTLDAALEALHEAALTLPPDDLSMRAENDYHLGVVLMELGRTEEAREHFRSSAARAGDEPWVADLRGRARGFGIEVGS
jgi:tetratricopeptide (TPR) repeat protein